MCQGLLPLRVPYSSRQQAMWCQTAVRLLCGCSGCTLFGRPPGRASSVDCSCRATPVRPCLSQKSSSSAAAAGSSAGGPSPRLPAG